MEPEKIVFPVSDYPIKVVARAGGDVRERIDAVFSHYFGPSSLQNVTEKASSQANFTSWTFSVRAESEQQLKDLNADLQAIESVLFVL